MSEVGRIEIVPRQYTEAEWLDAITLAMKADLGTELRRRAVEELLRMRRQSSYVIAPKTST